ncbi:type I methionyl aminopeptidase [Marinitoga arctica]
MILVKTQSEVDKMRRAGKQLAMLFEKIKDLVVEGSNAYEVEKFVNTYMKEKGFIPTFKGYAGFPYATCISVNEEIVHGFPLKEKIFKNGDIVSIDMGLTLDGYIADAARTFMIGKVDEKVKKLVEVTEKSFWIGIEQAVPGNRIGDISNAIQTYVESFGFSIIKEYVGHGVGRKLHEDPQIPNYGPKGKGPIIRKGMTFAIEPMVSMGDWKVKVLEDGWTAISADKSITAHYENTLVITENGPEVLTILD